jgi:hypothetical protein
MKKLFAILVFLLPTSIQAADFYHPYRSLEDRGYHAPVQQPVAPVIAPPVVQPTPPQLFKAFAASPDGYVFQSNPYPDKEQARFEAVSTCQQFRGLPCQTNISIPVEWNVIILICGLSISMGASAHGIPYAYSYAANSAAQKGFNPYFCQVIISQ